MNIGTPLPGIHHDMSACTACQEASIIFGGQREVTR